MSDRWRDALEQLDRYGPPSEEAINVVEHLADLLDDCAHGRAPSVIREAWERATKSLADFGAHEIQRAGEWP